MKTSDELRKEIQVKLDLKNKEEEAKKLREQEYLKSEEYKQKQIEFEVRKQKMIDEALAELNSRIEIYVDGIVSGSFDRKGDMEIKFCDDSCKYPASLSDIITKIKELGYVFNLGFWEGAEFSPSYSYITIDLNQFF